MIVVWAFSVICMASTPPECKMHDPVLFPRKIQNSEEECVKAGQDYITKLKLPEDKWAVMCMRAWVKSY